jgi:hypothetical protein
MTTHAVLLPTEYKKNTFPKKLTPEKCLITQNGLLVVQQLAVAPRQQIRRVGRGETAQLYQTLARLHQVKGKLSGVDPVRPPTPDTVGDTCDKIQV